MQTESPEHSGPLEGRNAPARHSMSSYAFLATGCLDRNASFVRLRELGKSLQQQGVDVHFLIDDTPYNRELEPELTPSTIHYIGGVNRAAKLMRRRRELSALSPAAVHILNPQPLNITSIAGLDVPVVCDWDELLSARARPWGRWVSDVLAEAAGRRICTLNVVASRYLQNVFKSRFGIDSLYLPYATYLPEQVTGTNPFARRTAVYLGNLIRDFDHDIAIDAWELLRKRNVEIDLSIIGGGELLDEVRRDVKKRGLSQVRIEGYLTGQPMWDRLRHAHVLLFPIRNTVGNRARCPSKTYAYMQAGRPIIANRVGEVAEVLGETADYVPATPEGFADAVERMAGREIGDKSYALDAHTWTHRAERLLAELKARGIIRAAIISQQ